MSISSEIDATVFKRDKRFNHCIALTFDFRRWLYFFHYYSLFVFIYGEERSELLLGVCVFPYLPSYTRCPPSTTFLLLWRWVGSLPRRPLRPLTSSIIIKSHAKTITYHIIGHAAYFILYMSFFLGLERSPFLNQGICYPIIPSLTSIVFLLLTRHRRVTFFLGHLLDLLKFSLPASWIMLILKQILSNSSLFNLPKTQKSLLLSLPLSLFLTPNKRFTFYLSITTDQIRKGSHRTSRKIRRKKGRRSQNLRWGNCVKEIRTCSRRRYGQSPKKGHQDHVQG